MTVAVLWTECCYILPSSITSLNYATGLSKWYRCNSMPIYFSCILILAFFLSKPKNNFLVSLPFLNFFGVFMFSVLNCCVCCSFDGYDGRMLLCYKSLLLNRTSECFEADFISKFSVKDFVRLNLALQSLWERRMTNY